MNPDFATVQELDRLGNKIGRRDGTALVQDGIVTQTQEPTLGQHGKWTLSQPVAPQGTLLTMRTVSIQSVDPNGGYSTEYLIDDGKHSDIIGNTVESCDFVAPGNYRIVVYYFYSDGTCYMGYQEFTVSLDATHTAEDYPTVAEKVSRIVTQCKVAGDDWQTSLNLHDWLTSHAYYDLSYSFYGAEDVLLRGTGVCDSYSKAYCYLLGAAGITVQRVHSDTHAWNVITLGNTEYHVDVTWDDLVMADQNGQTINETVSGGEQDVYFCINDELIYGFLDENAEHGTGKTYTGATSLAESYLIHTDKWVDGGLYWDDEKQNIGVYRDLIVDSIPNTADGEFTVPADQECVISISDEGRISACAGNEQYAKWARYFYAYKLNETGITGLNEFKVAYDPENMVFRATVGEGMILIDGTGKILANGDALSGKIQYQIRVANLPEGCDELQFTWDDQNLDATAPMAWQDDWREPEHRDGKNYIFIMPELIGTYNSEVMFVRTGENDQNHRYIKLNYNRAPQDNGSINITNAAPPVYGENDYTLTWTEAENADFCVVIWEKPDGNWEMFFSNNGSLRLDDVPEGIQLLDQIGNYQATVFAIKDDCIWRKSQTWSFAVDWPAPQLLLDRNNEANVSWNAEGGFVELPLHQTANYYLYAPGADGAKIYYTFDLNDLDEGNHFTDVWPGDSDGGGFEWTFNELPRNFDPAKTNTFTQYIVAVINYDNFNPEETRTISLPVHVTLNGTISGEIVYSLPTDITYTLDGNNHPKIARDGIFYVDVTNQNDVDFYGAYISCDGETAFDWHDKIADSHWIPKSEGTTTRVPLTVPRCAADDTSAGGTNTGLYQVHVYAIKIGALQKDAANTTTIHVVEKADPTCPVTVSLKDIYTVGEQLRVCAHYTNPMGYSFAWMEIRIQNVEDDEDVIFQTGGRFDDFWAYGPVLRHSGTYEVEVEIWANINGTDRMVESFPREEYPVIKQFQVVADANARVADINVTEFTTLAAGQDLKLNLFTTAGEGTVAAESFHVELTEVGHDWEPVDEKDEKADTNGAATVTFEGKADYFKAGGQYEVRIFGDKYGYNSSEKAFRFVMSDVQETVPSLTLTVSGEKISGSDLEKYITSSSNVHVSVSYRGNERPTMVRVLNDNHWDYWYGEQESFERDWGFGDNELLMYAEASWTPVDWETVDWEEFDIDRYFEWTAKSNIIRLHVTSPYGRMLVPTFGIGNTNLEWGEPLVINITDPGPMGIDVNGETQTPHVLEKGWFFYNIEELRDGDWWERLDNRYNIELRSGTNRIPTIDLQECTHYRIEIGADAEGYSGKSRWIEFTTGSRTPEPRLTLDRDNEANVIWNEKDGSVTMPLHQMANFYLYAPGADGAKIYYAGSKDEQLTEGNHFEDVWPGEDRGGSFGWFFSEVPDSFDPEAGHTFIQYIVAVVNYDDFNPEKTKTIYLPVHVVVDQSISSDVQFANPPYPYTGNQLDTSGYPIIARDEIFYVDVINNAEVDFYGAYITADGTASGTWIADSHWIPRTEGSTTRIPLTVPRCKADDTADGGKNTGLYQVYVYAIKIGAPQKNAATTQKIHVVEQKYPDCPVTVSMKDTYTVGEPLRVFAHYSNPNNYQFGWMEVVIYETADPDNVIWAQSGDFNDFWETDAICHSGGTYSVDVEIWRNVNGENQQVGLYRNIKTFRVISAGAVAEPQVNRVTTLNAGTNLVLTISTTEELATGESSGKAAADSFRAELIRVDHDWEWVDEREAKATATEPTDAGAQVTTATMTFDADEEYFEAGGHYLVWIAADKDDYDSSETEFQFVLTAVPDSAGQLTLKVDENAAAEQEVLSSTMLHVQVEVDPENRPTAIRILNGDEWEYWWGEENSFETEWSYGDGEKLIYAEATWDDRYDFDELEEHDWQHQNGREFDWNNDVQWTAKSNAILLRIGSPYGDMRKANATLDNEALAGGGAIKIGEDLILNISDTSITDTNGKPISNAWYACHIYLKQQNQYGSYWERVWENVQQLHSGVNLIPTYTLEENNIYQIEIGTDAPGYKGASTYLQFRTGTRQHDEQTTQVKRFTVSGINEVNEAPVNRELGLIAYQSGADWYYIEIAKAGDEYWNEYRDGNGRVLNDSWAAYEPGTYTLTAYAFGKIRDDEGHETTDESGNDTWREKIGEVTVTATAAENPLAEVTLTVNGSSRASVPVDENDSHTLNIAISGVDYATNYHVRLNEYGDNECIFDRDYAVIAGYGATLQIADRRIQPGKAYEITCDTWAVGYVGSRTTLVFLLTGENSPSVSLSVEEKDEYWTAEDIQVMASAKGHDPAVTAIKICTGDETRYIRGDETGDEEYFNLKDTDTLIYAFATTDPYDVDAEDIDWESLDWSLQATPIRIHANTYGYTHAPSFYVPGEVAEGDWLEITINDDGNARQMDVRIVDKDGNDHEYRRFGEPGTYRLCTNELEAGRTYEVIMNCIQTRYLWSETKRTVRVVEKDHAPEAFFNVDKTTVCVDEPFTPWVYAKDAMAVCIAGDKWKPPAETGGEWDIETWSDGTWGAWFGDAGTNNADWEWCFDVPGTYQLNAWARYETEDHDYSGS